MAYIAVLPDVLPVGVIGAGQGAERVECRHRRIVEIDRTPIAVGIPLARDFRDVSCRANSGRYCAVVASGEIRLPALLKARHSLRTQTKVNGAVNLVEAARRGQCDKLASRSDQSV